MTSVYRVNCPSCGRPFDAVKALECSCLHPVRSVRCSHCAACFCNDARSLDAFWRNAPAELWARRTGQGAKPKAAEPADDNVTRPMVLFADDDPTGRAIATRVIQALGFGVVVAENGEQALELARRYKPELIITDALMPRLDGREMGRVVKLELPDTRVVVITSVYKDARYKSEAMRDFGIDEYLCKPVNPAELRDTVRKYLGGDGRG